MNYKRKILDNGLRLITVPMDSVQSVTSLVMVGAGSRYETRTNNGVSHFLEHMAFKGTQKRPSALIISSLIDGIGGEFNAFTGKESTGYYIKSASNHIDLTLDVLSDMLQNSLFDIAEIEKERGVILEEINLYEDTPVRKIGDVYERLLYGDTPMGWDVGGEKDVIKKLSRKDFTDYMKSLYSPQNMVVVVAGGFDQKKVDTLVEKYFGAMKRFSTIKPEAVIEKQSKPQVYIREKKTEQVHIALGVRTVPTDSEKRYPLSVLATVLGGGMSSRLFHEIREKRGLAYYVRTSSEHYKDAGILVSTSGVDPKRVDEAVTIMVDEYRNMHEGKAKVNHDELKKSKEYLKGHLVLELEDSRSVAGFFAQQELLEKEILTPKEAIAKVEKVTTDQIDAISREIFQPQKLNLAVIGQFDNRQRFEKLLNL